MPESATATATPNPSFGRTVTAADGDGSVFTPTITAGKSSIRIGANCTGATPGASIWLRLYFLDLNSAVVGEAKLQLTADATPDWGGSVYTGQPINCDPCWPLSGSEGVIVKVDELTNGSTWTIPDPLLG
jgi:hypothetical protein